MKLRVFPRSILFLSCLVLTVASMGCKEEKENYEKIQTEVAQRSARAEERSALAGEVGNYISLATLLISVAFFISGQRAKNKAKNLASVAESLETAANLHSEVREVEVIKSPAIQIREVHLPQSTFPRGQSCVVKLEVASSEEISNTFIECAVLTGKDTVSVRSLALRQLTLSTGTFSYELQMSVPPNSERGKWLCIFQIHIGDPTHASSLVAAQHFFPKKIRIR